MVCVENGGSMSVKWEDHLFFLPVSMKREVGVVQFVAGVMDHEAELVNFMK